MSPKPAILITAGPTREHIDAVRFITNASSGKMGVALAKEALKRKLRTTVVAGPLSDLAIMPRAAKVINVVSADEMFSQVMRLLPTHNIFISAAAVSDYKPSRLIIRGRDGLNFNVKKRVGIIPKIKKISGKNLTLKLSRTPDILRAASEKNFLTNKKFVFVGFALESKRKLFADAKRKLKSKKCDIVVANETSAMESDKSTGAIFFNNGKILRFKNLAKKTLAKKIIKEALRLWRQKNQ